MGGSISKSSLTNTNVGIKKMNENVEKTLQTVLKKYSEMIKSEMGDYYQKLVVVVKEPGLQLPQKPNLSIAQIFGQKCNEDLVVVFEKKLKQFPKYAIETSSLFGTKLDPILMDIGDNDGIPKQTLCRNLSQLMVAFLQLIEQSVISLVSCRGQMDAIIIRLTQSFTGPNGPSGPIAESKANKEWFKKMSELQKAYTTQLKSLDKFFKKMNGITLLSATKLNKLVAEMQKLNTQVQQLPMTCSNLANELATIQTIDIQTAVECERLNIPETGCNKNAISSAIGALEQAQRLAAQKLTQRRQTISPVTAAVGGPQKQIGSGMCGKKCNKKRCKK